MKDIHIATFTLQSFRRDHDVRANRWFRTDKSNGNGTCFELTSDARKYLASKGFHAIPAPGSNSHNRWPLDAMVIFEEMCNDNGDVVGCIKDIVDIVQTFSTKLNDAAMKLESALNFK